MTVDLEKPDAAARPLRLAFLARAESIHTRRWLAYFAARGHDVSLLLENDRPEPAEIDARVRIVRFNSYGSRIRGPAVLRSRASLRRTLERLEPDVVHAHGLTRYGWLAAMAGRHPYVVSVWGSDVLLDRTRTPIARALGRWALRGADLVTGVSENLIRAAVAGGARRSRCRLVQFGVDGALFTAGPPDEELRAGLGLAGRRLVFAPRSLAPVYRHDVAVEALAALPPDVCLAWTRMGAQGKVVEALRARAAELSVADRIVTLPSVEHAGMPALYRLADVVLSIPESDAFPVTLLEAMACERPIVVSDLPAAREVLGPTPDAAVARFAGLAQLVQVGDARATAAAIERALALAPDALARGAGELRRVALERGDMDRSLAAMETEYRRLAALRDRGRRAAGPPGARAAG